MSETDVNIVPVFVKTPGDGPDGVQITSVGMEVGGKRPLKVQYSGVEGKASVWNRVGPGIDNATLSAGLQAQKSLVLSVLAQLMEEGAEIIAGTSVYCRQETFLNIPVFDAEGPTVVTGEVAHTVKGKASAPVAPAVYTLPEYKVVDVAGAKKVVKVTANGHTAYGDMAAAELAETIDRIEAAMVGHMVNRIALPVGATMEMLEYRRNAAMTLYALKRTGLDPADLDDVGAGIDPRDGMPFGDK